MTIDARSDLSTLDAAALAAERGLHLIPVWKWAGTFSDCPDDCGKHAPGKHPVCTCPRGARCISAGKHPTLDAWQTSATTDFTTLRDWFVADKHNVGVVCGPSQIVVVDVDPRNGGDETIAQLTTELGPLPPTLTADTGGGGTHFVFQRPTGELESKLGKGVDFLRDARQFLIEPSIHPSGQPYRWRAGCGPDEIAIAALPEPWIRRVRRAPPARPRSWTAPVIADAQRIERARRYLERIPGAVSGDNGHTQTFNAVAAVMFGFDLDPDATYDLIVSAYNDRCDPPWSERELRHKVQSVAKTCSRERGYLLNADRRPIHTTEQAADRAPAAPPSDEPGLEWSQRILYNDKRKPKRGYANVLTFVRHHPDYAGQWSHNTMSGDVWFDGAPMRDTFVHDIRAHIDQRLGFSPGRDDVEAAIRTCAEERPFHPIQQYLRSVDWDGTTRLSAMASDYFGAESPLAADLVRKWMISAVARALNPGCKVDTALMLQGNQGYFKSSFFAILGGAWHADSPIDIANKDSFQQIHAAWLYEFAELENVVTGRAESRLKAWLTSTHDMFRAPYARVVTRKARSCVICGTTNRQQFLTDDTGSRRFWIVHVSQMVSRELLAEMRDQLWAEAVAAYEAGESWWLDRDGDAVLESENEEYGEPDPWQEHIAKWLDNPGVAEVSMAYALESVLKLDAPKQDRGAQMRVARILNRLGWRRRREPGGARRWRYVRSES